MNLHASQSYQTHEELKQLCSVPTQIISPREAKPIIAIVQDIVSGLYRLTKEHVRISEKQFFNLMCSNPRFLGSIPRPKFDHGSYSEWTGHQLLSTIIPKKINIEIKTDSYNDDLPKEQNTKHLIKIVNGEVISGTFSKDTYQARTKGLIHSVYNEYGPEETKMLFDNTQKLVCNWLVLDGFSTGISDMIVDQETAASFKTVINDMKVDVYKIIQNIHRGKFENMSTMTNSSLFEEQVNNKLNSAIKTVGDKGRKQIDENTNRLINMIKSKAKGQDINVAQMMGCVGQQNVDGKRIPYGFDDRTLPHYTKYDDGPESRGFVESSFINGLTPQEFFFAAMGGREGLIDTAVQSVTGDTPIIIVEDGFQKYVLIGEWIDRKLKEATQSRIKLFPEQHNMELLDLEHPLYIPTVDEDGKTSWGVIKAVTRHDPVCGLYKIKTASGRSVIVTGSKSLLTFDPKTSKFREILTDQVKVGDFVPVTSKIEEPSFHNEYIYGSTYNDGVKVAHEFISGTMKFVPYAICSTTDFVKGFLQQYFINRSCYFQCSIIVQSTNKKELDSLALLCARIGVFGSFTSNTFPGHVTMSHAFIIDGNYAQSLSSQLDIYTSCKFWCSSTLDNCQNDVVLDGIVEITKLTPEEEIQYPKVYDLTVEGTLNFALANGLQVRDTSETGYIQRKLVKAMEDCKVNYDMTVRNANGNIIQFLYGEDGMDACKVESQGLPYIDMDIERIKKEYTISPECIELEHLVQDSLISSLKSDQDFKKKMQEHVDQLIIDRNNIINNVFKGEYETSVYYPVSLHRIINNASALYGKYGCNIQLDLDPRKVLATIEQLCKELYVNKNHKGTNLFETLLRVYLSPKKLITKFHLNDSAFDYVVQQIKYRFYESLVHPSEMVGVVAAQSIGEPATQLSERKDALIIAKNKNGKIYKGTIGKFVDDILDRNKGRVVNLGHDSVVMDLYMNEYEIIGVSNSEKTSWKNISQISRHPANGKLVTVYTRSGKKTCATLSHSFLKRTTDGIVPIEGSKLKVGDRIPVAKYIPTIENPLQSYKIGDMDVVLDKDFGWLCGAYIADGCTNSNTTNICKIIPEYYNKIEQIIKEKFNLKMTFRMKEIYHPKYKKTYYGRDNLFNHKGLAHFFKDSFGNGSYNKHVAGWVYGSNLEFIKGVLQGYYDGDGNVAWEKGKGMVRSASVSEQLTSDIIQLLSYVGIFSSKCLEIKREIEGEWKGGNNHTTQISRKYAQLFKDEIGFTVISKAEALDKVIAYQNREGKKSCQEQIDKIPELGETIAFIGKALALPGQSRNYGRWKKKDSIGRETLEKYIPIFEEANFEKKNPEVAQKIEILKQAAYSDVVWDEIVKLEIMDDPKEYVYDFTVPGNDSFMVDCNILVHNTLNSVHYDSLLALKVDGNIQHVTIGDFVETEIGNMPSANIESHPNDTWLGWIKDKHVEVMSTDENGKVAWKKVEAVTKHPVVNKDGSNTLVKVVLESGRQVIATKAKSFIHRHENQIVELDGDEVKVGMRLPVAKEHHVPLYKDIHEYVVPSIKLSSGVHDINIQDLKATKLKGLSTEDQKVIKNALQEDVVYEKVVEITELPNDRPYVYDLTVEHTRNFNLANGFALKDTFHLSGISAASKAVRGVPRLNELLSVSKSIKSPIMKIFLHPSVNGNKIRCLEIMNEIRTIRFKDIVISSNIYFDPNDFDTNIPEDRGFIDTYKEFLQITGENQKQNLSPWLLRLKLDKSRMKDFNVEMIELHHVLDAFYDTKISCMFSDDNSNDLVFRIKLEKQEDVAGDDLLTELKALEHNVLETVVIKGVPKIENVSLNEIKKSKTRYNPVTQVFEDQHEWMIYTDGSNLRHILSLDIVDAARCITNNVVEVYEVLGIEAARQVLYNEINEVLDNIHVNYRHIALLVDVMTNKGNILSVNRHGINRGDIGPLAKCSFEESTDKLIKAGIFAEFDKINGVAANIMLGQIAPCGTGDVKIIMDESRLSAIAEEDIEVDTDDMYADMHKVCTDGNFKIDFEIPTLLPSIIEKQENEVEII